MQVRWFWWVKWGFSEVIPQEFSEDYSRQLLSVGKCGLKSEGRLPFDLWGGAANTVDGLNGAQSALLCFNKYSFHVATYL